MIRINQVQWAKYRQLMLDAHESFNGNNLTWKRKTAGISRFGEDPVYTFSDINLKVLVQGNYFRNWPITQTTESGEIDKENVLVLINKDYLSGLGYLTSNGYFNFNPGEDRFILEGLKYKAFGDSTVSFDYNSSIHIAIILKREETATADKPYGN